VTNPDEIHIVAAQQEKIIDTPSTPAALALAPSPGMIPPAGGSSFLAIAGQREVVAPTGGSWSADIIVIGVEDAQREIRPPKFTPANVTVTGWNANGFTISGPAPASDQIVTVETARIADNTPARAQLRVAAATISDPDIPDALYAGETYPLDFRARGVDDGAIRVRVKERGKLVEEGGAQVSYRPTLPGSVEFEWYVSGQLVRRIDRVVSTLPVPTIAAVKRETEDRAIVETRSYGSIAGRANKVNLRILDGNVGDEPEEIDYRYDAASKMHTQRWRVWRHSPERDFSFTAWAIDQRGSAFAKQQRFVVP
jgi:hypothetical protein